MQMGESSKATVVQHEAIHMICKTDVHSACLTSRLAFRSLGIRQRARRFLPCQLDEGRSSPKTFALLKNHAGAERRLLAYRSAHPEQAPKNRMPLPLADITSDPKPETQISCTASLQKVPSPRPFERSSASGTAGERFKRERHVAGRTHAKRKRTWKTRRLMLICTSARWGPNDTRTQRNDKRPSLHPISLFSRETPPFGAAGQWLPIAEVPRRPEASQELRRRAACR